MSVKALRQIKSLSQEQLADITGLSLRTIQRVESGQPVSHASWQTLASYFGVSASTLQQENLRAKPVTLAETALSQHRAVQLIIFIVTFFVCVGQWMAYYAAVNPVQESASLGTMLTVIAEIAVAAAIFSYFFNRSKVTFVWSYYTTAAAFILVSVVLHIWSTELSGSNVDQFMYPVFYTLMLLSLLVFHVLQMALSLRGESVILTQR